MILEFDKMNDTILPNFYGGEKEVVAKMFLDKRHRIMFDTLASGASIGFHKHENSDEVIYILEGEGKTVDGDREIRVKPGMGLYCEDDHCHSLINDTDKDLKFFAVVTYY